VLPSGRFAVLGGADEDQDRLQNAEVFDPTSRAWAPLADVPGPEGVVGGAAVAVAGGLLLVGGQDLAGAMLFDEASGRWFTLPGEMPTCRCHLALTTVPAP
jgi:hypothetical protein